jgi:CspA family cold shock protein
MQTGIVKFFNEAKGFGFLKDDSTGKDIFVHVSGIGNQHLKENDKVTFEIEESKNGKGPSAVNVKLA